MFGDQAILMESGAGNIENMGLALRINGVGECLETDLWAGEYVSLNPYCAISILCYLCDWTGRPNCVISKSKESLKLIFQYLFILFASITFNKYLSFDG